MSELRGREPSELFTSSLEDYLVGSLVVESSTSSGGFMTCYKGCVNRPGVLLCATADVTFITCELRLAFVLRTVMYTNTKMCHLRQAKVGTNQT